MTNEFKPGFNVITSKNGYCFTWNTVFDDTSSHSVILTEEFVAEAVKEKLDKEKERLDKELRNEVFEV